jgi:cellulose synthase/poly-beta-1,6-N-acetylglucosamine synthase-like glycosyltransferase
MTDMGWSNAQRWAQTPARMAERLGPPRASVIIPHLNTPELLVKCLQAVAAQKLDQGWFEIIVVDNGSRVPLDIVAATWPGVRFLVEREPGPGPARNLGVGHSQGRVLAFVDADIRVGPKWLMRGVRAVERNPRHPYGGDVRIDFANPRAPTGIEAFEAVFSFRQKMYIKRRGFSGTGNLMVDRELWMKVGPFGGIGTAEDRDWGERAAMLGATTRYLPRMTVFHPARNNLGEMESRWARIIGHDFSKHQAAGRPLILWHARAVAVLASSLAHAPQLLLSTRVPTVGGRIRGLRVLLRTRAYRFGKMRRIAMEGQTASVMQWNRAP